jgi:uncharacterized membrane protein
MENSVARNQRSAKRRAHPHARSGGTRAGQHVPTSVQIVQRCVGGILRFVRWALWDVLVVENVRRLTGSINRSASRNAPLLLLVVIAVGVVLSGNYPTVVHVVSQFLPLVIVLWIAVFVVKKAWRSLFR